MRPRPAAHLGDERESLISKRAERIDCDGDEASTGRELAIVGSALHLGSAVTNVERRLGTSAFTFV